MFVVKRSKKNPILTPNKENSFESLATFNGNPISMGRKTMLLYRAQSEPQAFEGGHFSMSMVAIAESKDGINFEKRKPFITSTEVWDRYGCEDPRVTKIGKKYFCFYTALSAYPLNLPGGIKVGLAISKDLKKIDEKHLITPFNAKAMTLFQKK